MKIYSVLGNKIHLDGGAMFGHVPKAMWEKWEKVDDQNRIELATRCLLLQTSDDRNILFETGIGAFFEPKLMERFGVGPEDHALLKNLKKVGVNQEDVDAVVLSHLHFDHAGGLLPEYEDTPPRLLFSNANYYVSKKHFEYARDPHPREAASFIPLIIELLDNSDRLVLVDKTGHPDLDFGLSFTFSDGHTPGMMISEIKNEGEIIVFPSDLIPGSSWVHLPVTMGYDRYPEKLVDEKRELLDSVVDKKAKLFFTHDNKYAFGLVDIDEKGKYVFRPVDI